MSRGSSTNLPFSIDNILRDDFGPQRTQPRTFPRYTSTGYYVGTPWPYYYKYWPLAVSHWNYYIPFKLPIAGRARAQSPAVNQENLQQKNEQLENERHSEKYRSDSEHSDSDESGEIQSTNTAKGKRKHEETTEANPEEPKKKRLRSQFTEMQLKYLENYFSNNNSYLSRDERTVLAQALDMTELQIRNWFQNKRYQIKHKETTTSRPSSPPKDSEEKEKSGADSASKS